MLILASRKISRGATVDLQRDSFNKSERVLRVILLATILVLFGLLLAEAVIDLTECDETTF